MGLTLTLPLSLKLTLDRESSIEVREPGAVVRGPGPGCDDFYVGGRGGMGSTANGPSPRRRWTRGGGGDGAPEREQARTDPFSGD